MKYIILVIVVLGLFSSAPAQNWDWMHYIAWENPPPNVYPGYFSPSYSQQDSLLYFDTFSRSDPTEGLIYITKLDSMNYYDELEFADPVILPSPINIPGTINCMPSINHAGDSLFLVQIVLGLMAVLIFT